MASPVSYDELMEKGECALGDGHFARAAVAFHAAADYALTGHDFACAYQMRGIAWRLHKEWAKAEEAFKIALQSATGELAARIRRDLGMVYLDRAQGDDLVAATSLFKQSYTELKALGSRVEAAVSQGFRGRADLVNGNPRQAARRMREAHKVLHGTNETYELNNLVWLGRASVVSRWCYAARVLTLARRSTDNRRRSKEYLVLLGVGEHIYARIRARKRMTA